MVVHALLLASQKAVAERIQVQGWLVQLSEPLFQIKTKKDLGDLPIMAEPWDGVQAFVPRNSNYSISS